MTTDEIIEFSIQRCKAFNSAVERVFNACSKSLDSSSSEDPQNPAPVKKNND